MNRPLTILTSTSTWIVDNFNNFRIGAGFSNSIGNEQILRNLQVYTEDHFIKAGGVLFFGKQPEIIYEQAIIRCTLFNGIDKRFIADDKKFGGPLYNQYQQAMDG